jgi:hypothetical protein
MQSFFLCVGIILIVFVQAQAQDSVSISDFRYSETTAKDWKAGFFGIFNSGGRDYESLYNSKLTNGTDHSTDFQVDAHTSFLLFHVNDIHTFELTTSGFLKYSKNTMNRVASSGNSVNEYESGSEMKNGEITLNTEYLRYLTEEGFHLFGFYGLDYGFTHNKDNYESREDVISLFRFDDEGVIGVGHGRIRDGTFVIQALRIIERLREDGVIKTTMTHEQTLSLVDRVALQREYTTNYERHEKYLVQDIVEELQDKGVIDSQDITAYSSLRIAEGLRERIESRFFGWRVTYGFGANGYIRKTYGKTSGYIDPHNGDSFFHRMSIEFGHPLTLYTHLHNKLTIEVPRFRADLFTKINLRGILTHQVGERFDVQVQYQFRKGTSDWNERMFWHSISSSFIYFLEDQLRFTTSVEYNDYQYDYINDSPTNYYKTKRTAGFSLSFGLAYNII